MMSMERDPRAQPATTFLPGTTSWRRASFNAASGLTNLAIELHPNTVEERRQRSQLLLCAAVTLTRLLRDLKKDETYSELVRLPAVVLAAGIVDAALPARRRAATEPGPPTNPWPDLAGILDRSYAERALVGLLEGAERRGGTEAGDGPKGAEKEALTAAEGRDLRERAEALVDAVRASAELTPRTRYNLACFYASRHQVDPALDQLTLCLPAEPLLRSSAKADPTLAPLRHRARWKKLVDEPKTAKPAKAAG